MAPNLDQMKLKWIHLFDTKTELPPKSYQIIMSENAKPKWIRLNHEHTLAAKIAPKNNQILKLESVRSDNLKTYWIHVHTTTAETAPKINQNIMSETKWIHDHSTIEIALRPKKQITNPRIEIVIKTYIRILPEYLLTCYSVITKIRNMKLTSNIKSLTLPISLFMINLNPPTMRGDQEHKKTTDDNWIPIKYNLWFNLRGAHKETSNHDWTPNIQSPWLSTCPNRSGRSNQRPQSTANQHYLDASLMTCIRRNEDTTTLHKKPMIN
jgi:hypothetical protein